MDRAGGHHKAHSRPKIETRQRGEDEERLLSRQIIGQVGRRKNLEQRRRRSRALKPADDQHKGEDRNQPAQQARNRAAENPDRNDERGPPQVTVQRREVGQEARAPHGLH